MTQLLVQIGVSNLCVSLALAIVAWAVQRTGKWPVVSHLLWLLVLVKLVTPPILTVPLVAVPWSSPGPEALAATPDPAATAAPAAPLESVTSAAGVHRTWTVFALLWLLGSAGILTWSLVRICRFHCLLQAASRVAPTELQRLASGIARRLRLGRTPTIYTTSARLSPMVWWIGGKVRIVLPESLPRAMEARQLRWILAHELAHVRRRDHLVRWLEWLACVGFWWNPVAWWARRNLRINEELCCDALVLESLQPDPRTYANSLLAVVEFLAAPVLRAPAMASEIDSGGFLERRFKMITSPQSIRATPRWLQASLLLFSLGLLPLGIAHAQEPDYDAVGQRLRAAVEAGELTPEQVRTMLQALKKSVEAKHDAVGRRLRAAVAAGELTGDQARAMLEALKKSDGIKQDPGAERAKAYLEQIKRDLADAVRSGEISEEDAAKRFEETVRAVKERMDPQTERQREGERRRTSREEFERVATELREAVEAGRISEEDARTRLEGMRRAMAGQAERGEERRDLRREYAAVERRLEAAVESGRITEEEAKKRLEEFAGRLRERAREEERDPGARQREGERRDPRAAYRALVERLEAAVESGRITEEEAKKRLEEFRLRLGGRERIR